nr:reverse transcriptase domain-containing protein [Tanacetum cinerariifolium]
MNDVSLKAMQNQIDMVKNELISEMKTSIQTSLSNQTNEIKNIMASLLQMNTASTSGSRTLLGNTIANPKGELKAITTRSGLVTEGPTVPNPPKSVNPEEDECVEETYTYPDHAEYNIKVPPPLPVFYACYCLIPEFFSFSRFYAMLGIRFSKLDTDEKVDKKELEAHYSYMAKIQEVPTGDIGTDSEPVEQVQNDVGYNVFANDLQHSKQSETVSNTCLVEMNGSNVIPDSPDICEDDIQNEQNDVESDDERKANATLAQELKECKAILAETSKSLREFISVQDSFQVALQNKQTEFENYKAFNDRTIDYDKLKRKLNETLGQLAQKDIEIKEGLKIKAYELLVVKENHDELIKQSLLTKSHYEGLVKQKTKVITDLKLREEHDIDKMLSMEKQLKFLNEIIYKRSQSIQTIHMMTPKVCYFVILGDMFWPMRELQTA